MWMCADANMPKEIMIIVSLLFLLPIVSASNHPKVYEENFDHKYNMRRPRPHQPPVFNYYKATQQNHLTSRYAQQQRSDMANIQRRGRMMLNNYYNKIVPSYNRPISMSFEETEGDWSPVTRPGSFERNETKLIEELGQNSYENDLDVGGSEIVEQKLNVNRADTKGNYIYVHPNILRQNFGLDSKEAQNILKSTGLNYKEKIQLSDLRELIGKNPNVQLEGLDRLLNQKENINVKQPPTPFQKEPSPTPSQIQESTKVAYSTPQGPTLEQLQKQLDEVAKAQGQEVLNKAQHNAIAYVEAQHKAIALAQEKAKENALALAAQQGADTQNQQYHNNFATPTQAAQAYRPHSEQYQVHNYVSPSAQTVQQYQKYEGPTTSNVQQYQSQKYASPTTATAQQYQPQNYAGPATVQQYQPQNYPGPTTATVQQYQSQKYASPTTPLQQYQSHNYARPTPSIQQYQTHNYASPTQHHHQIPLSQIMQVNKVPIQLHDHIVQSSIPQQYAADHQHVEFVPVKPQSTVASSYSQTELHPHVQSNHIDQQTKNSPSYRGHSQAVVVQEVPTILPEYHYEAAKHAVSIETQKQREDEEDEEIEQQELSEEEEKPLVEAAVESSKEPETYQEITLETKRENIKKIITKQPEPNYDDLQYAAKYAFGYRILDHHQGNDFGHEEKRNGKSAKGQYHVLLPDGRRQKVEYYADNSGYHARVTYEQEAVPVVSEKA